MGKQMNFAHINAQADFQKILSHLNLEYTNSNNQLRLRCPFHDDDNPSLSITLIDTEKAKAGTWHCFGCGEKGSPIDFVKNFKKLDLRAAAALVADVSDCTLAPARGSGKGSGAPKRKTGAENKPVQRDKAKSAPPAPADDDDATSDDAPRCNEPLSFSLELDCLHESVLRRLDEAAAEHFGVGFLPETRRGMMKGRICIPIHNGDGDLVAYCGRYPDEDVPDDEQKYLFPPKFEKLVELYNLHRLDKAQHIVAVEGFFSAMRLHQLGVPVVALMGTAVSPEQVELLRSRGVKSVIVLFDGDEPGVKAAPRVAQALAHNLFVRIITLPEGRSPDEIPEDDLQRHLPFPLRNRL